VWVGQTFTSGDWMVKEGNEEVFLQAWADLADWCVANYPGTLGLYLIQDRLVPRHYVSFGAWADFKTVSTSRSRPKFLELFRACQRLCDSFVGSDYVAAVVNEPPPDAATTDGAAERPPVNELAD
jgi:quinol monooxygenase YgiN